MATYRIELSRSAERQLKKLATPDQERLARAMFALADNPRPKGSRKLKGHEDAFRVRVGRYRILCAVSDAELTILVLKIEHRRNIYA